MTDDIVARLRVSSNWLDASFYTDIRNEIREAADEIERLRGQIEHHARDRIEYCAAWSKWIEENDGLEIAQWCRAYADAVPYPNPDGPEMVRVIHSRLDARHRNAADEIERLRARIAELERFAGELDASGRKNTEPAALRGTPSDGEASASEGYLNTGASVQTEKADG